MTSIKNQSNDSNSSFKVFIRVRPLNECELRTSSNNDYMTYNQSQISVKIRNDNQVFTFDKIYHPTSSQQEVFQTVADDIIDNAYMGINGTIFCYGQTFSGKTHTIVGDYETEFSKNQGLLPRILREVILRKNAKIQNIKESSVDIRIKIAMVQIYNEKVMDLLDLSKRDLKLRQNKKQGVFIDNVTEKYIISAEEAINYVKQGILNRTVGKTNSNVYSSRSHMVFIITIHETNFQTREAKCAKITLTDLAGSQKISKTGVEGKMLIEAKKINTSLSALGKVIQALSESKTSHIPYRDSKLTRLLQQSIGGNSLTRLIINISPSCIDEYETITSLRFASRAKLIKNKPKVNKEYTVEELQILLQKAEIKIKQQMKIIEELQKGPSSNFLNINGGYSGFRGGGFEKSIITMHMVGDDEEEFNDNSSIGSQSFVKSVVSNQEKCHGSIFGDTGMLFNQTSYIELDATSPKKKIRKPNLSLSKSMKILKFFDPQDDEQIDDQMAQKIQQLSPLLRKRRKSVRIIDDRDSNDDLEQVGNNRTIHEVNESGIEQSLINSNGFSFELPCKSIHKRFKIEANGNNQELDLKQKKDEDTVKSNMVWGDSIKLSDITNNESLNHEGSLNIIPITGSRVSSRFSEDKQKQKQNIILSLGEEIKEQIKEQIKEKVTRQFKEQIQSLQLKIQTMTSKLISTEIKFDEIRFKYQENVQALQDQKLTIDTKDQHIREIKEKYKAKKNQINKEINKLKIIWQSGS